MQIVPYQPKYKDAFIALNTAWISSMFRLEAEDERELANIEASLDKGGQIFFAVDEEDHVLACCQITPIDNGEWELMKFAAAGMYTGVGAGSACLKACIEHARQNSASKIVLVSNRRCTHALHLYQKFGFTEIPVDKTKFPYERGDIAFELSF